ncbi:MAG: hypothetical protein QM723_38270 [Myxococcaceae bacterium]
MSAPEIDLLIAAEKAAKGPSPEVRARLGARLQASIAAPAPSPAPAAPTAGAGIASKLLVAVGFGALLGAGLHATLSTPPEAPKVVAPAPTPPPAAPPVVEAVHAVDSLAQERRLLELAREDVARSGYSDALATLAAHRALYPTGQLAEEREALGVQVLVRAGRYDEARSEGAKFVARFPNGLMVPVVEAALGSIPVTGSGKSPQ